MAGVREMIKTAEGIRELAFILSVSVETVENMAKRFKQEGNQSEQIIEGAINEI
jgi:transposase